MSNTVTLATTSNLRGGFEEWGNYLFGTPIGTFFKTLMLLGMAVVAGGVLIALCTRAVGRNNVVSRFFFPSVWTLVAWMLVALVLSSPMTAGPILGLLDKVVDFLFGAANDKLL